MMKQYTINKFADDKLTHDLKYATCINGRPLQTKLQHIQRMEQDLPFSFVNEVTGSAIYRLPVFFPESLADEYDVKHNVDGLKLLLEIAIEGEWGIPNEFSIELDNLKSIICHNIDFSKFKARQLNTNIYLVQFELSVGEYSENHNYTF